MKIDLGHGAYLEPDEGPRNTPFHKRIVRVERIPNTRVGNNVILECGHRVQTFGDLTHAAGLVLCTECRDSEQQ
jgi:hypothetical protein